MSNNGVVIDITARDQNVSATLQGVKESLTQSAGEIGSSFQGMAGEIGSATTAAGSLGAVLASTAGPVAGLMLAHLAIRQVSAAIKEWISESRDAEKAWRDASESVEAFGQNAEDQLHRAELRARGWTAAMLAAVEAMQKSKTVKLPDNREMSGNEAIVEAGVQINKLTADFERAKNASIITARISNEQAIKYYDHLRDINDELQKWISLRTQLQGVETSVRGTAENVDRIQAEGRAREDAARKAAALEEKNSRARGQALVDVYKMSQDFEKDIEDAAEHDAKITQKKYEAQQKAADAFRVWSERQDLAEQKRKERMIEQEVNHMVSGFTSGFAKVMRGQQTFGDFMKSMFERVQDIALGVLDKWITAQIMAAITGKAIEKAKAVSEISAEAGVAGAGATANAAPFLGPAAVGVGEGVAAATLGAFLPMASAAGGFYSIPYDQPVFTHRDEQILPAEYAKGLRSIIAGGGGSGANFTIVATDSKDVERQLRDQGSALNRERRRWERRGRVQR